MTKHLSIEQPLTGIVEIYFSVEVSFSVYQCGTHQKQARFLQKAYLLLGETLLGF